jgi:ribosomal protein L7/L12
MYLDDNKFAKIVDALTTGAIDYKAIALAILKSNPDVFAEALEAAIAVAPALPYERNIIDYIRGENMVGAIKELRTASGLGLKEAKDVIDSLRTQLHHIGRLGYRPQSLGEPPLDLAQRKHLTRLLAVEKMLA